MNDERLFLSLSMCSVHVSNRLHSKNYLINISTIEKITNSSDPFYIYLLRNVAFAWLDTDDWRPNESGVCVCEHRKSRTRLKEK